jgi:KDO2-lipid IV(A) lauroyltransferase
MIWTCSRCPWLVPIIRPVILWFAWRCSADTRRITLTNARRLLGEPSSPADRARLAKSVILNFTSFILEMGRNRRRTLAQMQSDIESIEGLDRYTAARAQHRGAILAAAHLGAFELAVAGLRGHEPKVHVVFRRDNMPIFESLRQDLHARLGVIEAPIEDAPGALGPWLSLREALKNDEVVLLQADRTLPGQRGVRVPFLSGHLEMPPGPIKLALASGSPIVPVFSFWQPSGKIKIVIEQPIEVTQPWGRESIHPALLALARVIERYVKAHPDQWFVFEPALCEDQEHP